MYMLHRLRATGLKTIVLEAGSDVGAPGTGTDTLAHDAMFHPWNTRTVSHLNCNKTGTGLKSWLDNLKY